MTYEFSCSGKRLILRIFHLGGDPPTGYRIEARPSNAPEAQVAAATALTRADALDGVAREWTKLTESSDLVSWDWQAVTEAMTTVRAI